MSGTAGVLGSVSESGRAMLPLARRETPRRPRRVLATDRLIAPPCEVVLPTLENAPVEQRFSADEERKQQHIERGYGIEDERPIPVNGFCSFVAVRETSGSDTFSELVAQALNGNHGSRVDY